MTVAKFWDPDGVIKVRIRSNQGIVEFINYTSQEVKFFKESIIGTLDLRSLGYFIVNYEDLVRKLGQQFTFSTTARVKPYMWRKTVSSRLKQN